MGILTTPPNLHKLFVPSFCADRKPAATGAGDRHATSDAPRVMRVASGGGGSTKRKLTTPARTLPPLLLALLQKKVTRPPLRARWHRQRPGTKGRRRRLPPREHGGAPPKLGTPPPYAPPCPPGDPHIHPGVSSRRIRNRYLPKQPCALRTCVRQNLKTPWCLSSRSSKRRLTATIAACPACRHPCEETFDSQSSCIRITTSCLAPAVIPIDMMYFLTINLIPPVTVFFFFFLGVGKIIK